ncbi:beta-N-acetylhexosaminidase [Sphingobacterium kyonggiense]
MIRTLFLLAVLLIGNLNLFAQGQANSKDFKVKGFHLDLRVQVMKMPALKKFAKQLKDNGMNTLIMEWEATYPFQNHPLIPNQFAYTREEVKEFIAYCEGMGIDVIPLQQSFGHVEYILRHYRYKDLREDQKDYSQINPLKEDLAKELFTDLFKDMVSTHHSDYIHIGGDETYLLGHSKESQKKVAEVGKGRLYGDYIKLLCELVVSLGKKPVLWADIALKYPDALKGLPKETVFVDWNYGWDINMFGKHENLLNSGFEIWGAPSLRSHPDNYFITQWEKHFRNIREFIPLARGFGYQGMVITSWSTSGLYSSYWESPKDIVELYPVRRVYPLSGFNLLVEAYFRAANQEKPLEVDDFVRKYAQENYGLSPDESIRFWKVLAANPYEINQGVVSDPKMSIREVKDSAIWVQNEMKRFKPTKNQDEFKHYQLMSDIRARYLVYMDVEEELNRKTFDDTRLPILIKTLKGLLDQEKELNARFMALNKDFLFEEEIAQEDFLRNSKIQLLYNRLTRLGN